MSAAPRPREALAALSARLERHSWLSGHSKWPGKGRETREETERSSEWMEYISALHALDARMSVHENVQSHALETALGLLFLARPGDDLRAAGEALVRSLGWGVSMDCLAPSLNEGGLRNAAWLLDRDPGRADRISAEDFARWLVLVDKLSSVLQAAWSSPGKQSPDYTLSPLPRSGSKG